MFNYYSKWGLGIGDWGLGIGPNPQSPIPNPHTKKLLFNHFLNFLYQNKINKYI